MCARECVDWLYSRSSVVDYIRVCLCHTCTPGGMGQDSNLIAVSGLTPGEIGCLSVLSRLSYCDDTNVVMSW